MSSPKKVAAEDEDIFCCKSKEYYLFGTNLVDSLEIFPRVITCRKKLKKTSIYDQTIRIRNSGLFPRSLHFFSDCENDTKIVMPEHWENEYLLPGTDIAVHVVISPKDNNAKNNARSRHIYIAAKHPNIVFEIPIIVIRPQTNICIPEQICFPSTVAKQTTFYEFVAYNATQKQTTIMAKAMLPTLTVTLSAKMVPRRDYVTILLALKVLDMRTVNDVFKIKFSSGTTFEDIRIIHEPVLVALFPSVSLLRFDELKYGQEAIQKFTVCNESQHNVQYTMCFLSEKDQFAEVTERDSVQTTVSEVESCESTDAVWRDSVGPIEPDDDEILAGKFLKKSQKPESRDFSVIAYKHFCIDAAECQIEPHSSATYSVRFKPCDEEDCVFEEHLRPPFSVRSKLFIVLKDELGTSVVPIILLGTIMGPEIDIDQKLLDLRKIYMGEEHCEQIQITNLDENVEAVVTFKGSLYNDIARVKITPPEGITIPAQACGSLSISFFACIIGKFILKLRFKVKNGDTYDVFLKGLAQQVRVRVFPNVLEYGDIPFAVPQKRYLLLINPLSVPVTVRCSVSEDGEEPPLVLNIVDVKEFPPFTVANHVKIMLIEDKSPHELDDPNNDAIRNKEVSEHSINSASSEVGSFSTYFEDEVLETIPDIARNVVTHLKEKRVLEKMETEKKIVYEVMEGLLNLDYFKDILQFSNYAQLDWNTVPSHPQEIYCDGEIIYLKPNTGKTITVILIPNISGYYNRSLDIRVCPIDGIQSLTHEGTTWDVRDKDFVNSELMISKFWLDYNCCVPDITFNEEVTFDIPSIYTGQEYDFFMEFTNNTNVGGFLYYDVVPKGIDGNMYFTHNEWKHFVGPEESLFVSCYVVFSKPGPIKLSGIVKVLGRQVGYPFHIIANVLPAKVNVTPSPLTHRQKVNEPTRFYMYVENVTPTVTFIKVQLKATKNVYIEPLGAMLGPKKQGTYFTIHSLFDDPEVYKNIVTIDFGYGKPIEIPLTINIVGMPIYFEPNIKEGFDAGVYLVNSEKDYYDDIPRFTRFIKIRNIGERCYRITINKLKSTNNAICAVNPGRGRINVSPKLLFLLPKSVGYLEITGNACDPLTVYNEFRMEIADNCNRLRVQNIRFVVTAKFIAPEATWSRKEIQMEYRRTHPFKEHPQLALVNLLNTGPVDIDFVQLKTVGPFRIKAVYEFGFSKEVQFRMEGLEKRLVTIMLHKSALRGKFCEHVDGRILCMANDKQQKSLAIRVNILCPQLIINPDTVILFTKYNPGMTHIMLENKSCLEAQYKWKKISEYTEYTAYEDDVPGFSRDILSDIIRMLELNEEIHFSDDDEPNMTLRYLKYRCLLQKRDDEAGVMEILNELIDNLDLEHKRYLVRFDDVDPLSEHASNELASTSSKLVVKSTISNMLKGLKLEDSYDISDPSSEDCDKERTIYFYEKAGMLPVDCEKQCYIYLPPVKPNYAHFTKFVLDVVGGVPQEFNITLVNLENVIHLSKNSIFLGITPWYEQYKTAVRIQNVTQYPIHVFIEEIHKVKKTERLQFGYGKLVNKNLFFIPEWNYSVAKFDGLMGFSSEFSKSFNVIANESDMQLIRLRGQGIMPTLTVTDKLKHTEMGFSEVINSYQLLQRIYYFEMFRSITEVDEEQAVRTEEDHVDKKSDYSDISLDSGTSTESSELKFFKVLSSYVLVNHNDEVPNAVILEQLLDTEKFLDQLKTNEDTSMLLQMVYQNYLKFLRSYDEKMPINLKHFTAQPLPFETHGFVLNMGEIPTQTLRRYVINISFFGPGKLIAAARMIVRIPGLFVDFDVDKSQNKDYIYYTESQGNTIHTKPYRNQYERKMDLEHDVKLKHAHSFDTDALYRHKREISAQERKEIQNYYNSLNKSVYLEHKHHHVLCKIFSNSKKNYSFATMRVILLLKAENKFYEDGQMIDDFLYIDLHMGPTLPILLQGVINKG